MAGQKAGKGEAIGRSAPRLVRRMRYHHRGFRFLEGEAVVERSVVAIVAVAAVALESAFRYFETVGSSVSSVADQVVELDSGIPEVVCDLVVEALGAGATVHWDNSECHVPRLGHNIGGSSVMKSRFYIKRLGNSVARLGVRRGWRSRGVHFLSVCLAELFCR